MWFDASKIDPAQGSSNFPVGNHVVCIRNSRQSATKAGDSGMLILGCEILDGPSKGMMGDYRLNIWHTNPQTTEIAHKQLSALCHVTGRHQLNDQQNMCSEMFGIPFRINVVPQENNPQYTQVASVADINNQPPTKGQMPASAQQAPQQPAYQPPQQAQAPGWAPQGQMPIASPAPSWQPPGQGPAPAPAAQPSWTPPGVGGPAQAPQPSQFQQPQQQAPAAPSWAQQPQGAAPQPSWQPPR